MHLRTVIPYASKCVSIIMTLCRKSLRGPDQSSSSYYWACCVRRKLQSFDNSPSWKILKSRNTFFESQAFVCLTEKSVECHSINSNCRAMVVLNLWLKSVGIHPPIFIVWHFIKMEHCFSKSIQMSIFLVAFKMTAIGDFSSIWFTVDFVHKNRIKHCSLILIIVQRTTLIYRFKLCFKWHITNDFS